MTSPRSSPTFCREWVWVLACAIGLMASFRPAAAATFVWVGGGGTTAWYDMRNWNQEGVIDNPDTPDDERWGIPSEGDVARVSNSSIDLSPVFIVGSLELSNTIVYTDQLYPTSVQANVLALGGATFIGNIAISGTVDIRAGAYVIAAGVAFHAGGLNLNAGRFQAVDAVDVELGSIDALNSEIVGNAPIRPGFTSLTSSHVEAPLASGTLRSYGSSSVAGGDVSSLEVQGGVLEIRGTLTSDARVTVVAGAELRVVAAGRLRARTEVRLGDRGVPGANPRLTVMPGGNLEVGTPGVASGTDVPESEAAPVRIYSPAAIWMTRGTLEASSVGLLGGSLMGSGSILGSLYLREGSLGVLPLGAPESGPMLDVHGAFSMGKYGNMVLPLVYSTSPQAGFRTAPLNVTGAMRFLGGSLSVLLDYPEGTNLETVLVDGDAYRLVTAASMKGRADLFFNNAVGGSARHFLGIAYIDEGYGSAVLGALVLETPTLYSSRDRLQPAALPGGWTGGVTVLSHGWRSDLREWVDTTAPQIATRTHGTWLVIGQDWAPFASLVTRGHAGLRTPSEAAYWAREIGESLAYYLLACGVVPDRLHAIAHSAGSYLADGLIRRTKALNERLGLTAHLVGTQLTLLDAFTPSVSPVYDVAAAPSTWLGSAADWSEQYYETGFGQGTSVSHSQSVNVVVPSEGCQWPGGCHGVPYVWYSSTITSATATTGTPAYGFALSAEVQGRLQNHLDPARRQYRRGSTIDLTSGEAKVEAWRSETVPTPGQVVVSGTGAVSPGTDGGVQFVASGAASFTWHVSDIQPATIARLELRSSGKAEIGIAIDGVTMARSVPDTMSDAFLSAYVATQTLHLPSSRTPGSLEVRLSLLTNAATCTLGVRTVSLGVLDTNTTLLDVPPGSKPPSRNWTLRGPAVSRSGLEFLVEGEQGDEAIVEVFDVLGRRVVGPRSIAFEAGAHRVGAGERIALAPGFYLVRARAAGATKTIRQIVL